MKKYLICVLMITLLMLPGCGEREAALEAKFDIFREELLTASEVTLSAELTADYGQTVSDYKLDVSWDGEQTRVTVLEPELIAGVSAMVEHGESELCYDGLVLVAGAVDKNGLTPVAALPVMLDALAGNHIELLWWEEDTLAVRLYLEETSFCTVWLNGETLVPLHGEICSEGQTVIFCDLYDWNTQ